MVQERRQYLKIKLLHIEKIGWGSEDNKNGGRGKKKGIVMFLNFFLSYVFKLFYRMQHFRKLPTVL